MRYKWVTMSKFKLNIFPSNHQAYFKTLKMQEIQQTLKKGLLPVEPWEIRIQLEHLILLLMDQI